MVTRSRPDDLWLEVGYLTKPHGLHGSYLYKPHGGDCEHLESVTEIRLVLRDQSVEDCRISSARPFKKGAILAFEPSLGSQLEKFRGAKVHIQRADLPSLESDEVYVNDLLGLQAILSNGKIAGTVRDAVDTGSTLSLLVEGELGGAVPYHHEWVGDVDFSQGTIELLQPPIS